MTAKIRTERRRAKVRRFRLERSIFLRVPTSAAVFGLIAITAITVTVDLVVPHKIWFGPIYLLIASCAGWFVGARFAVVLGFIVISVNSFIGNETAHPYGFQPFHIDFALKFLSVLAVALMLGMARKSLEREWRLARTDPLTGALNRQAFFEAIKSGAGRSGPAVLIFADVDGLKRLNDVRGHERGDDALRDFAGRLRNAIRKSDLFARIGGDEFVVFMKVKDEKAAKVVARRLNEALNLESDMVETTLRCSLGVLFMPKGSSSIDAELKLADKLMYSAKRVQAGFLMASAIQLDGQEAPSPALETALPTNLKSVIRQASGHVALERHHEETSKSSLHADAPAI